LKYKKVVIVTLTIIVISYLLMSFIPITCNKVYAAKVPAGTFTNDINGIDENLYPGYKALIQNMKSKHSNYTFKLYYTGLDWNEALVAEYQGHGKSPKNLFQVGDKYNGKWMCPLCGNGQYDNGSWRCASLDAIAYMMDPRNSINDSDVFQFKTIEGADVTYNDIARVVSGCGTFLNNHEAIQAIVDASNQYNINGYFLVSKIINEHSKNGSALSNGNGYNGKYVGCYNYFNIGAYGNGKATIINNGLAYAQSHGWTSIRASILGGVAEVKNTYINEYRQDTLYYQKFNVVGNNRYQHQYQQNILAAQNEGTSLQKLYKKMDGSLSGNYYTFIIPLYKNMPATASPRPSTTNSYTISSVRMGDTNGDGSVNIADIISVINHIKGAIPLSGNNLTAAKVTGNSDVTVADVVLLINYLKGSAVLPSSGFTTATLKSSTGIRLAPNGSIYSNISAGTSVKVISEATTQINWAYWDLVVTPKGLYGYIDRNSYK